MTTLDEYMPRWDERSFTDWWRMCAARFVEPREVWRSNFAEIARRCKGLFVNPATSHANDSHIAYIHQLSHPPEIEVYDFVNGLEVNRRRAEPLRVDHHRD